MIPIPSVRIKCGEGLHCSQCINKGTEGSGYMTKNELDRCDFYSGPNKSIKRMETDGKV